jgi:hypothetical protein
MKDLGHKNRNIQHMMRDLIHFMLCDFYVVPPPPGTIVPPFSYFSYVPHILRVVVEGNE